jgi:hypothetical protein
MAAEPRKKAAKKKKRRRVPREEFVDYVGAIEDWERSYSLLLNTEKHPVDPYHEFPPPRDCRQAAATDRAQDRQGRSVAAAVRREGAVPVA